MNNPVGLDWSIYSGTDSIDGVTCLDSDVKNPVSDAESNEDKNCVPGNNRPAGRRPHPAPSGKRALQSEGSFRTPRSAERPHPLSAIMPNVASKPSGWRPGARPVEVCPSTCAISSGKRRTGGRQRIAGLSAAQKPISPRQFAACPEFSPDFLPCLFDFSLCPQIEMLIRPMRWTSGFEDMGPPQINNPSKIHAYGGGLTTNACRKVFMRAQLKL